MNSLEQFNQYYKNEVGPQYEKSLKSFFETEVKKRLPKKAKILDIGSGSKSLFSDQDLQDSEVLAIDFSSEAINKARGNAHVKYQLKDITEEFAFDSDAFDLIFDSHCFHCIVDANDRSRAFKNIYAALKPEGLFAGEMMVQSKTHSTHPLKHIPEARALEEEILSHGFKIIYFMIVKDLSFIQGNDESDLLRVIARK